MNNKVYASGDRVIEPAAGHALAQCNGSSLRTAEQAAIMVADAINAAPLVVQLCDALKLAKEFEQHAGGTHLPAGAWFRLHETIDAALVAAGKITFPKVKLSFPHSKAQSVVERGRADRVLIVGDAVRGIAIYGPYTFDQAQEASDKVVGAHIMLLNKLAEE